MNMMKPIDAASDNDAILARLERRALVAFQEAGIATNNGDDDNVWASFLSLHARAAKSWLYVGSDEGRAAHATPRGLPTRGRPRALPGAIS